jgi:SAM-dependent methyltransferase
VKRNEVSDLNGAPMNLGAIGNLAHRLKLVRELPPRLVYAKIAKRLPWSDKRAVRVAEIIHSPKDLKPDRLFGFFRRQESLLEERIAWQPIDFNGRKVIEIGPGPLAGCGPMAIFRGAAQVYGVDPDWIEGAFDDPGVEEAYLRPHHAALTEAFGPLMDYATFRTRIVDGLKVEAVGLEQAAPGFMADIVISNSCLEHIEGLDASLRALATLSAPDARFLHLVNFGNHRNRASPFETIYEMPPAEYRIKFGGHINLLRATDVLESFAGAEIDAKMIVVDRLADKVDMVGLHTYWQEHYEMDDLAVRTALFVGLGRELGT